MSHIPEDRHKHGLVLDYTLEQNLVLQRYLEPQFQHGGFIRFDEVRKYADKLIEEYDIRSGQGPVTVARSMSGGNQQKAIVAREIDRDDAADRGGAADPRSGRRRHRVHPPASSSHERDEGKAVLLVSLELDEVMNLSDRILVMYEGEIVGEFDPEESYRGRARPLYGRREAAGYGGKEMNEEKTSFWKKDSARSVIASLLSILIGLLAGSAAHSDRRLHEQVPRLPERMGGHPARILRPFQHRAVTPPAH